MRRPCADREEKRVTRGSEMIRTRTHQEQLDLSDPNQRGLSGKWISTEFVHRHPIPEIAIRRGAPANGLDVRESAILLSATNNLRCKLHQLHQLARPKSSKNALKQAQHA